MNVFCHIVASSLFSALTYLGYTFCKPVFSFLLNLLLQGRKLSAYVLASIIFTYAALYFSCAWIAEKIRGKIFRTGSTSDTTDNVRKTSKTPITGKTAAKKRLQRTRASGKVCTPGQAQSLSQRQ